VRQDIFPAGWLGSAPGAYAYAFRLRRSARAKPVVRNRRSRLYGRRIPRVLCTRGMMKEARSNALIRLAYAIGTGAPKRNRI
jgi:hypothetical protein